MAHVDLNCDMGESFGSYTTGMDEALLPHITSANIACGFHAGDPMVLDRTVRMAAFHKVAVGAHPGFPDLMGFGRRKMDCTREEIKNYVIYQVGAVQAFCSVHGVKLQHVKPHGSLYNMAVGNVGMMRAIAEAVVSVDPRLILVGLAGAAAEVMVRIAGETGVRIALEAFPDRAYTAEGTLVPRGLPGALIEDPGEAAERAVRMAVEGRVVAADGTLISLKAHTLCVHGDNPTAVELVRSIRGALRENEVQVRPMGTMAL